MTRLEAAEGNVERLVAQFEAMRSKHGVEPEALAIAKALCVHAINVRDRLIAKEKEAHHDRAA